MSNATRPGSGANVNVFVAATGNEFMRDIAANFVEAAEQLGRRAALVTDRLPAVDGSINLVINTPRGTSDYSDGADIRRACTVNKVTMHTTLAAALAAASGIAEWKNTPFSVRSLQEWLA